MYKTNRVFVWRKTSLQLRLILCFAFYHQVAGGNKADSAIVHGVVCSKNVAHKNMKIQVTNPKILLLTSAVEYQRVENKFSSIDPVVMQVQ